MACCGSLCKVKKALVLIGGLNLGLVGIGDFLSKDLDVIHMVLGSMPQVESILYVLIGLSALCMTLKCVKGGKCKVGG